MITVAIDAMGGDLAPTEIVKGTLSALNNLRDTRFILVGREDAIKEELSALGGASDRIEIMHAPEVVEMETCRWRRSSASATPPSPGRHSSSRRGALTPWSAPGIPAPRWPRAT